MTENGDFTTISIRPRTHERIRYEADVTGLKMWALVDRMAENYFNQRENDQ